MFKANKNTKILNFANDDEEDYGDEDVPVKKGGIKSQHDIIASKTGIQTKNIISEEQLAQLRQKKEAAEAAKA